MKKVVFKIGLFSTVVLLLYLTSLYVLSNVKYKQLFPFIIYTSNYYPLKGGHTYQSFSDFTRKTSEEEAFDLVFLGSSHAYRGFDPRIFKNHNLNSFNLGTSGQDLESSEIVYKHFIRGKKIKTVLLEIYCRQFEDAGDAKESSFDITFNSPGFDVNKDYIIDQKDWRFVNLALYKCFTLKEKPVYLDSTYVGDGYSERWDSLKNVKPEYSERFNFSSLKYNTLERIINECKTNNQQLILISHPLPKEFPETPHRKFIEGINPLLAKYGIRYFDYTYNHSLNTRDHFYDQNHMNQKGVEIFNTQLLNDTSFLNCVHAKRN